MLPRLTAAGKSPAFRSRVILVHRLARAEQHVLDGDLRLRQQRRSIDQLAGRNKDTVSATAVLRGYEKLQTLFLAERDHLANELAGTLVSPR
jgi:hypothetical protein